MTPLEKAIAALYRLPLTDFVSARTRLARTLSGDDAKQVKGLAKPTVIPWAVNQLYWHDRRVYDRVISTGARLRLLQIAALEGGAVNDIRVATEANQEAIAHAVKVATQLALAHGIHPQGDGLTQMFGALAAAATPPQPPGRLTAILMQPTGFAALEGVTIKAKPQPARQPSTSSGSTARETGQLEHERAEAERRAQAAIAKARADLDQAKAIEISAEQAWAAARTKREEAERTLRSVTSKN